MNNNKCFQLHSLAKQALPEPLTRGSAPGLRWGLRLPL